VRLPQGQPNQPPVPLETRENLAAAISGTSAPERVYQTTNNSLRLRTVPGSADRDWI